MKAVIMRICRHKYNSSQFCNCSCTSNNVCSYKILGLLSHLLNCTKINMLHACDIGLPLICEFSKKIANHRIWRVN